MPDLLDDHLLLHVEVFAAETRTEDVGQDIAACGTYSERTDA